jgi:peptide/nickel transport system permease protein
MQRYILIRILQAVVTLLFVSILIFVLARLGGDPLHVILPMEASEADFARARKHLGLDKPLPVHIPSNTSLRLPRGLWHLHQGKDTSDPVDHGAVALLLKLAGCSISVAIFWP